MPRRAFLYAFSGLPGSGKSTLSQRLAGRLAAAYLRIDTIEQALRDLCRIAVQGEGYRLACRLALDNLRLGVDVVADGCNPVEPTRRGWHEAARQAGARCVDIEVVCSDAREHRRRVESRVAGVPGLVLPAWSEVAGRELDAWTSERIVVDTAHKAEAECLDELLSALSRRGALPD